MLAEALAAIPQLPLDEWSKGVKSRPHAFSRFADPRDFHSQRGVMGLKIESKQDSSARNDQSPQKNREILTETYCGRSLHGGLRKALWQNKVLYVELGGPA